MRFTLYDMETENRREFPSDWRVSPWALETPINCASCGEEITTARSYPSHAIGISTDRQARPKMAAAVCVKCYAKEAERDV